MDVNSLGRKFLKILNLFLSLKQISNYLPNLQKGLLGAFHVELPAFCPWLAICRQVEIVDLGFLFDPNQIGAICTQDCPDRLIRNLYKISVGIWNKKVVLVVPNQVIFQHAMILVLHFVNLSKLLQSDYVQCLDVSLDKLD